MTQSLCLGASGLRLGLRAPLPWCWDGFTEEIITDWFSEDEQKFSWQRRKVSDVPGRGNSMCKRQEARGTRECCVFGWLVWPVAGRRDPRRAGPTRVDWDAVGCIWICTGRDTDIHGAHSARRNTGGWIQMSLQLIKVSASMKHK